MVALVIDNDGEEEEENNADGDKGSWILHNYVLQLHRFR